MTINNHAVDLTGASPVVAIDTNFYGIQGPADVVSTMWAQVSEVFSPEKDGFYAIREWLSSLSPSSETLSIIPACNLTDTITFEASFGGRNWSMTPTNMNLGPLGDDPENCRVAIFGTGPPTTTAVTGNDTFGWVFGGPFLVRRLLSSPHTPHLFSSTVFRGTCTRSSS